MKKIKKIILWTIGILVGLGLIAYVAVTTNPQLIVGTIQKVMYKESSPNSFSPLYNPVDGLKENGQYLKSEIRYSNDYPNSFLDVIYPPTLFVLAGKDKISQNAKLFIEEMKANKKDVTVIEYPKAVHSFIESNNPEGLVGATTDMSEVVNDEQQNLSRQAENEIYNWLLSH